MNRRGLFLFSVLLFASCWAVPMQQGAKYVSPTLPKYPTLFEVSTRPWLYSLSQKYGRSISTLNDIPDEELQSLADLHVDVLWLMGLWQLGSFGLKHDQTDPNLQRSYSSVLPGWQQADVIGSPYAIVDYVLNSELGSKADLQKLRDRLHSKGMSLCVDFVPNHAAVDTPYATSNPDWFVRQPAGQTFDPNSFIEVGGIPLAFGHDIYSGAWTDTLQWNYWNPSLRSHLVDVVTQIASVADFVRCDMAMNVLNAVYEKTWGDTLRKNGFSAPSDEFWATAISAAHSVNPNFKFLAEAYVYGITSQPEDLVLQQLGFAFTYDKSLLDDLHNGQSISGYITWRGRDYFAKSANFLSNHDEPRAIPTLGGVAQSLAAASLVYTLPGLRFFWMGQKEGFSAKLDVHLRRESSESEKPDVEAFYKNLMTIIHHPVFQNGEWNYVQFSSGSPLIGWRWSDAKGNKRFVAVNYSPNSNQYGEAVLPDCTNAKGDNLDIKDLLTGDVYTRSVSEMKSSGLKIVLQPWQAQIFDYTDYSQQ